MIVSPEYLEVLMLDEHFIKRGDLSQEMVQAGVAGKIAGFNVFESNNMDYENTTRVTSKKTTTEFIAGHPNWCHRVMEWQAAASTSAQAPCRAARSTASRSPSRRPCTSSAPRPDKEGTPWDTPIWTTWRAGSAP